MTDNKYHIFLEKLRRSGETNMFGATPYLMKEFGLRYDEAVKILVLWMSTYDEKDYEGMENNG
jgi:hypothetical protein